MMEVVELYSENGAGCCGANSPKPRILKNPDKHKQVTRCANTAKPVAYPKTACSCSESASLCHKMELVKAKVREVRSSQ